MRSLIQLLTRSLVRTYYEANVGFFLVVLYLAFGLLRSTEHIVMANAIANSWPLTLLTSALWAVYGLKTIGFIYHMIQTKAYRVVRDLAFYPANQQWVSLTAVHFMLLFPVWAYGLFISYFAIVQVHFAHVVTLLLFLTILTIGSAGFTIQMLKQPTHESKPGLWHRWISHRWALPKFLWYVRHVFVHEALPTFFAKIGSLVLLAGSIHLYQTDTYDWRLLGVGTLFAFGFNTMLVYGHYAFNQQNEWEFNIPFQKTQLVLSSFGTWVILFIPEMVVIIFNTWNLTSVVNLFNLCLFMVALAFFWTGLLTRFTMSREAYGKRSFYLVLVLVVVIMFAVPLAVTNGVLLALGSWGLLGIYQLKTTS